MLKYQFITSYIIRKWLGYSIRYRDYILISGKYRIRYKLYRIILIYFVGLGLHYCLCCHITLTFGYTRSLFGWLRCPENISKSTSNSWFDCWKGIEKIWCRFWTATKFSIANTRWCIFFWSKMRFNLWFIRKAIPGRGRQVFELPGWCSWTSKSWNTEFWNCNWAHYRSLQSRSFCQISITTMKWTLRRSSCTINHIDC